MLAKRASKPRLSVRAACAGVRAVPEGTCLAPIRDVSPHMFPCKLHWRGWRCLVCRKFYTVGCLLDLTLWVEGCVIEAIALGNFEHTVGLNTVCVVRGLDG